MVLCVMGCHTFAIREGMGEAALLTVGSCVIWDLEYLCLTRYEVPTGGKVGNTLKTLSSVLPPE